MQISTSVLQYTHWYDKKFFQMFFPVLGFALFWPFQRFSSFYPQFSEVSPVDIPIIQSFYVLFLLLETVLFLIIIFARHRVESLIRSSTKKLALSCSFIGLSGSLLILKASQDEAFATFGFSIEFGAGLLLLAFYGALMFIAWGFLFEKRTTQESAFIIVMGAFASSTLYLFLYINPEFDLIRSAVSPFLAALFLFLSFTSTSHDNSNETDITFDFNAVRKALPAPPVILGLTTLVLGLPYIRLISSPDSLTIPASERMLTQYGLILIFGILCFYLHFYSFRSSFLSLVSAAALIIMLFGLLLVILLSASNLFFYGAATIKLSCDFFEIILWLAALLVASQYNISRCLTYGLYAIFCTIMPSLFPDALANSLNSFLQFTQTSYMVSSAAVLSFFLSVLAIAVFCFTNNYSNKTAEQCEKLNNQFLAICTAIAEKKGLTARELDVLTLYCQGHTLKGVADKLNLANTTVQGYSRSLYQKLGVHSRQELVDLVDAQTLPKEHC